MYTPILSRPIATIIFSLGLVASTQPAFAAPLFQVQGAAQDFFDKSSSLALSDASLFTFGKTDPISGHSFDVVDNAIASAGPDGLHADANTRFFSDNPVGAGSRITAGAQAFMFLDDVMIGGPAGGTIITSYRVHLSGTLEADKNVQITSPNTSRASATVSVGLSASNLNGNLILLNTIGAQKESGQPQVSDDQLQNLIGGSNLTSASFSVTANKTFTVELMLAASAISQLGADDTGSATAAAHFGSTLTFATDGPVFDLPAGYTANSISGNIADNHFALAPIPLPAAIWLLGSALGCIGFARRRA